MKALIAGIASLLLLVGGGLMGGVFLSVPAASDEQRELYVAVVRERHLQLPWEALLAVDTVRFRQDFSRVDRASIEQTADLFAMCLPFVAHDFPFVLFQPRPFGYGFTVPRQGTLNLAVLDVDPGLVQVKVVDEQLRPYDSGAVLPKGDYHLRMDVAPPDHGFRIRVSMELKPCGPEEVAEVMDKLGLQGDDRQMVLHLMAMHMPPGRFYPVLDPKGPYVWPLADSNWPVTSTFGLRLDPVHGGWAHHDGIDLGADPGTAVHAAAGGFVMHAGYDGNYGNVVRIQHEGGHETWYAHLEHYLVAAGQQVSRGEAIGLVGSTGKSTGPHLHFEWRVDGVAVDPLLMYR